MNSTSIEELEFLKYKSRGAYHWEQISAHPVRSNAFVKARYERCIQLVAQGSAEQRLKGKKVLDVGCGDGVMTFYLSRAGAEAYGIDSADIAIEFARTEHARRRSPACFSVASAYDTGFPNENFDAVVCTEVIEHVQDPERVLSEIKRILRPGGVAVISTPIRYTKRPLDKMHVIEWFEEDYESLIRNTFENAKFFRSHPLAWMELIEYSRWTRLALNLAAIGGLNPFHMKNRWKRFALQYAVTTKH